MPTKRATTRRAPKPARAKSVRRPSLGPARASKAKAPARREPTSRPTKIIGGIRYGVPPSVAMMVRWIETLKDKTGRSLDEWTAFIEAKGPATEAARRAWLKDKVGVPTNSAWFLAARSVGQGMEEDSPEAYLRAAPRYVDEMYQGKATRALHDRLVALGASLGPDVRVCPCATIVPLYRHHVFAQIKPSTRARIDLGLCLAPLIKQGEKLPARLVDTGGFAKKDRVTHRIEVSSPADIDAGLERWLRRAYDLDA